MNFDQGQFNFDAKGPEDGFRKWREELDAKKLAFETRWGVALGRRVIVSLKNHAKPISGILEWVPTPADKSGGVPTLRLKGMEFPASEIESMVREEIG